MRSRRSAPPLSRALSVTRTSGRSVEAAYGFESGLRFHELKKLPADRSLIAGVEIGESSTGRGGPQVPTRAELRLNRCLQRLHDVGTAASKAYPWNTVEHTLNVGDSRRVAPQ